MNTTETDVFGPLLDAIVDRLAPRVADMLAERLAERSANDMQELPVGLVDKATAARAIGISVATLDRLTRAGAPVTTVGARRRFDIPELRAWVKARGRRSTAVVPSTKIMDRQLESEVDELARAAGLRPA
jgi:hypothetical protein